jgi:hypothetical protein
VARPALGPRYDSRGRSEEADRRKQCSAVGDPACTLPATIFDEYAPGVSDEQRQANVRELCAAASRVSLAPERALWTSEDYASDDVKRWCAKRSR